ncbi:phosphatase PAP2 family protein [Rathayibacter sp. VKM Ac-2803]|nr:phosphatase PAP2 family protein [Rathayibacter sp. VKM Ac-2803]
MGGARRAVRGRAALPGDPPADARGPDPRRPSRPRSPRAGAADRARAGLDRRRPGPARRARRARRGHDVRCRDRGGARRHRSRHLAWKLSGHAAVVATCAVVVLIAYGPWSLLVTVPIALWTGWSRVRLGAHTPAQVIAGGLVGAVLASAVWSLLA